MYDLTSFSSYSQMINFLEYGYNRDGVDLPQINLSMVVDKEKGIPVMYDIYPGSIVDVTTLDKCQWRLRIFQFRRFKTFQFTILEKSSRIVDNAENGGMAIDTRFVFTRL